MNLIPDLPVSTPNYWCTWTTQNRCLPQLKHTGNVTLSGDQGARLGRDNLDEQLVFGSGGWAEDWKPVHGDLYLMFDDGWDVPRGVHPADQLSAFGSVIPDSGRFPSCTGAPEKRLAALENLTRKAGWRGAGLWIAAQAAGEDADHRLEPGELKHYWQSRLEWCREAGITYWKVDWGVRGGDLVFRCMLVELAHEIAPSLLIENSIGGLPLNGVNSNGDIPPGRDCFANDSEQFRQIRKLLEFSTVARTYDTADPLSTTTTLDRCTVYLNDSVNSAGGLVNVEDDAVLGAALGCSFGIMRSGRWTNCERDRISQRGQRLQEIIRAVRFQRLAPAFGGTALQCSEQRLSDGWIFQPDTHWFAPIWGKTVIQSAPAVISRNMSLPRVTAAGSELPYVTAMQHPNGTIAVATFPRLLPESGLETPLADVALDIDCSGKKIGVFGHFRSLSLALECPSEQIRIYAQDLAGDSAEDITDHVKFTSSGIMLQGPLLERIGTSAGNDKSAPGLLLAVCPADMAD